MEENIEVGGIQLHYEVSGPETGQPVILMHGWGCDHSTVASIANVLNKEMRVYNIDLPGHGKSEEPTEVWGIDSFTKAIEEFIAKLKIKSPILIGHSFGGRISLLLASRNKIEKMVLVDAAGIKPRRSLKYYVKVYSFKAAKRLLPFILGKQKGARMIEKWRNRSGSADYKAASPKMRAIMSRCVNEDLKHVMPSIGASTLLIWGEKDTATPLRDARTMARLIPDAGIASDPDGGHYSFLDNPGWFRAVLSAFILK